MFFLLFDVTLVFNFELILVSFTYFIGLFTNFFKGEFGQKVSCRGVSFTIKTDGSGSQATNNSRPSTQSSVFKFVIQSFKPGQHES